MDEEKVWIHTRIDKHIRDILIKNKIQAGIVSSKFIENAIIEKLNRDGLLRRKVL